jgi:hypothetical protein
MADNQRVHPTTEDVEKNAGEYENEKPSSPLVPKSSAASEKDGVYPPSETLYKKKNINDLRSGNLRPPGMSVTTS